MRFSPEQVMSLAREAFNMGRFEECLGFLRSVPTSSQRNDLEARAAYAQGKVLLSEGRLGEAREHFSKSGSFRRQPLLQSLSQERSRLLGVVINNTKLSVLAVKGLASRARVKQAYELATDQFSPVVDYVRCLAAYRSQYDEERSDDLSRLIRLLKRGGEKETVTELGKLLADFLYSETPLARTIDFIIAVPQEPERVGRRGYSIPHILAEEVSNRCAIPLLDDIVSTTRTLPELRYIPRWARKTALEGAFELTASRWVEDRSVLIVDDVVTSGATMLSLAEVLKQAGAIEVSGIALAHTERSLW